MILYAKLPLIHDKLVLNTKNTAINDSVSPIYMNLTLALLLMDDMSMNKEVEV